MIMAGDIRGDAQRARRMGGSGHTERLTNSPATAFRVGDLGVWPSRRSRYVIDAYSRQARKATDMLGCRAVSRTWPAR